MPVLVLNTSYEPLHVVPVRRAVVLILKERAQLVESADAAIHAANCILPRPLVIRLVNYVRLPYRAHAPVSRRGVFARDEFTCQYCGRKPTPRVLTVDHVVPRVQGGERTWQNLVAACAACNRRKGGRRPEEAGMSLRRRPGVPRHAAILHMDSAFGSGERDRWTKYFPASAREATAIGASAAIP